MKIRTLLNVAVVVFSGFATSAYAVPYLSMTFHGHIDRGIDSSGVFGSVNQDLTGLEYVQTITLSSDPKNYSHVEGWPVWPWSPTFAWYGGSRLSMLYPATASVTVNQRTLDFRISTLPSDQGFILDGGYPLDNAYPYANRLGMLLSGEDPTFGNFTVEGGAFQVDIEHPFVPFLPIAGNYGSFISQLDAGIGSSWFEITGLNCATFTGDAEWVEVTGTDVPEPTSIALFAVGLAGVSALYRKRTS